MYDGIKGISSSALHFAMKVPLVGVVAAAIIAGTIVAKDEKEVIKELIKPRAEPIEVVKTGGVPARVVILEAVVLFDFDKFNIDSTAEGILEKVTAQLDKHPDKLLALEGHTDKFGSDEYNQGLSENRANAVKSYLVKLGVPANKIIAVKGFGKTLLLPKMTHRQNRRVILLFVDK